MSATGGDMRAACKEDPPPTVDAFSPPSGQKINAGDVGAACAQDTDCKKGAAPTCWERYVLDVTRIEAPSGYCTASCKTDADCDKNSLGKKNVCVNFGQQSGSWCMATCEDAQTCRHPGYSCVFLGEDDMGNEVDVCAPAALMGLDCDPTQKSCMTEGGQAGGCYRQAYENEEGGRCLATCRTSNDCGVDDVFGETQCLFLDFTRYGDGHRGPLCFPSASMPKDPGATCQFTNECTAGYQCDNREGGSRKCEKLCGLDGKAPRCDTGKGCAQTFGTCNLGLCK
jgi:hypothetical protein